MKGCTSPTDRLSVKHCVRKAQCGEPQLPTTCITMLRRGHLGCTLDECSSGAGNTGKAVRGSNSANLLDELTRTGRRIYHRLNNCKYRENNQVKEPTCNSCGAVEKLLGGPKLIGWWSIVHLHIAPGNDIQSASAIGS
jgi:hypothetical protein